MIYLPFEDRIVFVGTRWQGGIPEHIKERVKQFQFSPVPDVLRSQYRRLMECTHDGFGCIAAASMKAGRDNVFTADWVAGGELTPGVWNESFADYDYPEGRLQNIYNLNTDNNPKYFAFMTGTGNYIGDMEDCFGSKEAFKELILANKKAEITERLIAMLRSGVGSEEYIELDDLIL